MSTDDRHDRLFKTTFSDVRHLEVELRAVLSPDLVADLDFESLRILRADFEIPGMAPLRGDLLVETKFRGDSAVIVILVEHQSTVDELMPLRCLGYQFGVWTDHVKRRRAEELPPLPLPAVIPVVIHHGARGWTAATSFHELFSKSVAERPGIRRHLPDFSFILDDLALLRPEEILDRVRGERDEVAATVLMALRYGWDFRRFLESVVAADRLVAKLVRTKAGLDTFREIFAYFQAESGQEFRHILERAMETSQSTPETENAMTSIADLLINEGKAEGLALGEARGEARGEAKGRTILVLKQMTLKFGQIPEETRTRVSTASVEELDGFAERILFAETLEEVLG